MAPEASAARDKPIVAVCGKGGVGKTVVTSLLARVLRDAQVSPLLLIDADPVSGLTSALGEKAVRTLGAIRAELIGTARHGDEAARRKIADNLDYLVFQALAEREGYALLCMGRTTEQGCFCPVNTLLRQALDLVVGAYAVTLIDAEAGIEQINRQVTRKISRAIVVTDGSLRSRETLTIIADMVGVAKVWAVANRAVRDDPEELPAGVQWAGAIPEDESVRSLDRAGGSLWAIAGNAPALRAARIVAAKAGLL